MKIDLIRNLQHQCPELEQLLSVVAADSRDFWLVGGCLRDLLMNLPVQDIDLVSSADPTALAKKWSGLVKGRWFWLDQKRLHSRVLLPNSLHVDFSPLKSDTLEKDLELRDFTINSMAVSCSDLNRLIDPFNGYNEIGTGCIRPTSGRSFVDDPLRMLKGIRHAVTLDMVCPAETIKQIQEHAQLLTTVSGERIRDELMQILSSDDPVSGLDLLWKTGLLAVLFSIEQKQFDSSWLSLLDDLADLSTKLKDLKAQCSEADHKLLKNKNFMSMQAIYLLVQVLQLLQPKNLEDFLHNRLKLSRYEQRLTEELITIHNSDFDIFWLNTEKSERTKALMVEQFEPFSLEKMIYISLFDDHLSFRQCMNLYRCFSALQVAGRVPDLLSGIQVRDITECPDGVAIGVWHKKLKQAEIDGKISNVSSAKSWLKKQVSI